MSGYDKIPDVVFYHGNCLDGFTAAWVVYKKYGKEKTVYIPLVHNEPLPKLETYINKHVLMVDFSYPKQQLDIIASHAWSLTILDHHKSAMRALDHVAKFAINYDPPNTFCNYQHVYGILERQQEDDLVLACFDTERSGAALAWDFLFQGEERPQIVEYVQDRDLWRFALGEETTKAICDYLMSFPYDFDTWTKLDQELWSVRHKVNVIDQGRAINRAHVKNIEQLIPEELLWVVIDGHRVPAVNVPYFMASETGNILLKKHPGVAFVATYFVLADGRIKVSLRSTDFDVSKIATRFGGGGHVQAAGFVIPGISSFAINLKSNDRLNKE